MDVNLCLALMMADELRHLLRELGNVAIEKLEPTT